YLAVDHSPVVQSKKSPPQYTFGALVFLYALEPDRHTSADMALNGLVDAVDAALTPPAYAETQTLGGLVQHCWIEGAIENYAGKDGVRAAAIVPVKMLFVPLSRSDVMTTET